VTCHTQLFFAEHGSASFCICFWCLV